MNRLDLFLRARNACDKVGHILSEYTRGLLEEQIQYLIDLETGNENDRSRLRNIRIGLIAVHDIAPFDHEVTDLLVNVDDEAKTMMN